MRRIISTLVFNFLILFTACQNSTDHDISSNPEYGGILRLTVSTGVGTLDPQQVLFYRDRQLVTTLYEGLTAFSTRDNTTEPALAESWNSDSTLTHWVFTLRSNVSFHDDGCFKGGKGRLMVADDVVSTFKRIADPQNPSVNAHLFLDRIQGLRDYHEGRSNHITGIEILDKHRIAFTLNQPSSVFLKLLAIPPAYIIPPEAVIRYGEALRTHAVGTGPFRLLRWRPLQELVFGKHKNYWRKDKKGRNLPYVDAIQVLLEGNPDLAFVNFIKAECDILEIPIASFNELASDSSTLAKWKVVGQIPELHVRFFGFSLDTQSPFAQNAALRRTLAENFERETLTEKLGSAFSPAYSLVPTPLLRGNSFRDKTQTGNGKKHNALQFNWDGEPVEIFCNQRYPVIEQFQHQLKSSGFDATITVQEAGYYKAIQTKRPDIFRVSFVPGYPDPEEYYSLFYSGSPAAFNLTGFKNPAFDKWFEQAASTVDEDLRQEAFLRMEDILRQEAPALLVSHGGSGTIIASHRVHGFQLRSIIPDFTTVWLEPKPDGI